MATATDDYRLLIGGEWVPGSGGAYGIVNPATEETFAEAPEATAADAEAAAAAARDALPGWKRTSPEERANLIQALADEIRKRNDTLLPLIMAETGATLAVGSALQVPQAVARFERYARGALQDISVPLPAVGHADDAARGGGPHRWCGEAPARRRRRVHRAVQLPAHEHGRQGRARARDRQHHRHEAPAPGSAGDSSSSRRSARRSASRRVSSTSSPGPGPRWARRSSTHATST